jgi:hypothetical protein
MALHAALTRHVRESTPGPKVAALFDLDHTLLAGFSAGAFIRERFTCPSPWGAPASRD